MTVVWVAVLVLLVALAYYGMWLGWAHRGRRHDVPQPRWQVDNSWAPDESISVTYVSTTTAGNWLDRITAHGLGAISTASLAVHHGALVVMRRGARSFEIPAEDLVGTRRERGIAGKVRNNDGLVVITWRLGDLELDTGIRPAHKADLERIEQLVAEIMEGVTHG